MSAPRIASSLFGQGRTAGLSALRRAAFNSSRPACRYHSTRSRPSDAGASFGLVSTVTASLSLVAVYAYYSSRSSPIHLEAVAAPNHLSLPSSSQMVVDGDTYQALPLYLPTPASPLPAGTGKLKLVGLGVRTVSFLSVRVYVAAFYVDEHRLQQLAAADGGDSIEKKVKALIDDGAVCAIRIVPVRSTDFAHLRDGFVRALQGRLKKALKDSTIVSGSDSEEAFSRGVSAVKEAFPRGSVPKGSALDLILLPTERGASLHFEYDGKSFGSVAGGEGEKGFSVARELALAYFSEKGEISAKLKKSVEQGLAQAADV